MNQTFDEYWEETKKDYLADLFVYCISPDIYGELNVREQDVKEILNSLWDDARRNITTKDI